MKSADIIIIGGGMVGLALAALLADTPCQIKMIEKNPPHFNPNQISNRVSAINAKSQAMLKQLGVWQDIPDNKKSAYEQMLVWEKDSFAKIHFDNHDPLIKQLGLSELGHIIENQFIQQSLWQKVASQKNVEIILAAPQTLGITENGVFLTLDNQQMLSSKLIVGADGAASWLRNHQKIPLVSRDYQHTALVCTLKTGEPHQKIARQIFAKESILAFLPLNDPHYCSIVWSLPPEKAQEAMAMSVADFNKALNIASDNQLGLVDLQNDRAIYPLVARYARDFASPRLALVGDAAHTIHPLAGLGVNLGFADVVELASQIKLHLEQGHDIGEYRHLRAFERKRKAEAVKLLMAMEGIKQLFSGDNPFKKFSRGLGLSLTNQLPLLKKQLIQQAVLV